ncbi:hypothetical protein LPJ53_003588 [Coemansia erecta]|uniref:NDT80 domain-containing protein n=1 Tax=Coemansia erecta TaxID=147472 RepID=A0A9W7XZL5_9FUNG|nr:hypothetical protein LPJ53_003588 [Coemansia erecta]
MSPNTSNQLYMEAIASAGISTPPAPCTAIPSEIKGSDINLLDWYKPPTNSSSTTSLMINSRNSIDFTMPATTSPPKPCMPSKRRVTIPHTGSGRKPHSLQNAPHSDEQFFSRAAQHHRLFSPSRKTEYKMHMFPQIDRGFFQSGDEWTCYRRNYFQISGYFWLSVDGRPISHPITYPLLLQLNSDTSSIPEEYPEEGEQSSEQLNYLHVVGFSLGISAHISEGNVPVELVQHTPKRDKGPQTIPQPQPIEPSSDGMPDVDNKLNVVSFERLQFKTATANNGKRRAAQQYYVLSLHIYAHCESGEQILLATTSSSPVVVRGRSPGHYADGGGAKRRTASTTHMTLPDMERRQSLIEANLRLHRQQQTHHHQQQQLLHAPLTMANASSNTGFTESRTDAAAVFSAAAAAVAAISSQVTAMPFLLTGSPIR